MSPLSQSALNAAQEKDKALLAMPLKEEPMKGKVDLKHYGHSGFKISFVDDNE